jgi:four helix bundle protein
MRRAAVSVGANIAEGCSRDTSLDFKRFLQIALGSANEVAYCMIVGRDLGYLGATEYASLAAPEEEVRRMLISLIRKLRASGSQLPTSNF